MQPKLIIAFERMSEGGFLAKAQLINSSLAGNVNFPLPWPASVPSPAQLDTGFQAYQSAYNDAMTRDRVKAAARNASRLALTAVLKKIARYLEVVADGSVAMLQTTGYDLRRDAVASAPDILPAPENFKVVRGAMGGSLVGSASVVSGAGSYVMQLTTGDPTVAEDWSEKKVFMHCPHMEWPGLAPGTKVSLRLCAVGTNGQGAWTDAVTIFVG